MVLSKLEDDVLILPTLGWTALALAGLLLFAADQNPGYSLSVYRELPLSFWALVSFAIVSATLSIGIKPGETRVLSVLLLFASILVVLLAPAGLGYNIYGRGDLLRHLGEIKYVSTHGRIREEDFEALFHVHGAILSDVLGTPVSSVPYLLSIATYTVYVLGFLTLFRRVGGNRNGLLTIVAILPVYGFFHTKVHPAFLSFFFCQRSSTSLSTVDQSGGEQLCSCSE
jgi:small-conductance mechanosensitive channel